MKRESNAWCQAPCGCERRTRRGAKYCDPHQKRLHRTGQLGGPIAERLTPEESLGAAANDYANAEADEDFASARRRIQRGAVTYVMMLLKAGRLRRELAAALRPSLRPSRKGKFRHGA